MSQQTLVWIAGTGWDSVPGTDKRLVEALSKDHQVLWIDPPVRVSGAKLAGCREAHPEVVSGNVRRVQVHVLPGITRPGIRYITSQLLNRAIKRALRTCKWKASAVIVAFPLARFPRGVPGQKVIYITDDWLDGSPLMGFSRAAVERALVSNLRQADIIASVSEHLSAGLLQLLRASVGSGTFTDPIFAVVPNGCPEPSRWTPQAGRQPVAGLVGQLNERLDLDFLEAVQSTGVSIDVIGPRTERDPAFRRRLDTFLAADNVRWMGHLAPEELAARMVHFGVGLTPYADTPFNRASFPLKTLEYLAAGLAVISTEMPAAHWLNTRHVTITPTPERFADAVIHALSCRDDQNQASLRRAFAANHTWAIRAKTFRTLLESTHERTLENDTNSAKIFHFPGHTELRAGP